MAHASGDFSAAPSIGLAFTAAWLSPVSCAIRRYQWCLLKLCGLQQPRNMPDFRCHTRCGHEDLASATGHVRPIAEWCIHPAIGWICLGTGALSPVRADSSISRVAALMILPSADMPDRLLIRRRLSQRGHNFYSSIIISLACFEISSQAALSISQWILELEGQCVTLFFLRLCCFHPARPGERRQLCHCRLLR